MIQTKNKACDQTEEELINKASYHEALISLIMRSEDTQARAQPYLLDLQLKILRSSTQDPDPLTPEEREFYNRFSPWERNVITTGSPIGIPEYRTRLIAMPGETIPAPPPPPGPMPNVAAPVPGPVGPPAIPVAGPSTTTKARPRSRMRRPPPPASTRVLRSAGPVEPQLLPEPARGPRKKENEPRQASQPQPEAPLSMLTTKIGNIITWNPWGRPGGEVQLPADPGKKAETPEDSGGSGAFFLW